MNPDNAYAELGLAPGASENEVKAAWRRLASQWHPDRNRSAAAISKMQRINQAIEQIRRTAAGQDVAGKGREASAGAAEPEPDAAKDSRAQVRTISRTIKLMLEEAAAGCIKVMRGSWSEPCASCAGAGFRSVEAACSACEGVGNVRQRTWFGWSSVPMACEACDGEGAVKQMCEACAGSGKLPPSEYRMNVRIPHGVRDGDRLQVSQRLAAGIVVQLDLRVKLLPHAFLELGTEGSVHCEVPVDGFAWVANRAVEVPTLTGMQRLQLSRDCLSYRLEGQGFPVERRGARGDHLVKVRPIFPERLGTDQEILLDQLIATSSGAAAATPLGDWRQKMQAWEQGSARRGS